MKYFLILILFCICQRVLCIKNKPVIIAHRGASGYLPEHTLEAKVAGFLMHADYLEQDVVLTRDNVPIVLHDIYLDTVTDVKSKYPTRANKADGRFYAIDFDWNEIKTLKVSERFNHLDPIKPVYPLRFPLNQAYFQLSSLEEEIQLVQGLIKSFNSINQLDKTGLLNLNSKYNPGIYVEIKDPEFHRKNNKADFSKIVINLLAKYNYTKKTDNIIVQCFDAEELQYIRNSLKSNLTLVQLLYAEYTNWTSREGLEKISKFADGIGPEINQLIEWDNVNQGSVGASDMHKNAKELGLFIHPYTFRIDSLPPYVNDFTQLLKLFINDLQVEGLFTDFPNLVLEYVQNDASKSIKTNLNFFISFSIIFSIFYQIK